MKEQVLSIEQMQELQELGIDTSKASMCWIISKLSRNYNLYFNISNIVFDQEHSIYIPTFTLQDILEMLPQSFYVEKNTNSLSKKAFLQINKTLGGGYNIAYKQSWDEEGKLKRRMHGQQLNTSLLEATFELLKWVKLNNYM